MADIVSMAEIRNDSQLATPRVALIEALQDIESGRREANKALLIFLNDADGQYDMGFQSAGLRCSEMLGLVEALKIRILHQMDLI